MSFPMSFPPSPRPRPPWSPDVYAQLGCLPISPLKMPLWASPTSRLGNLPWPVFDAVLAFLPHECRQHPPAIDDDFLLLPFRRDRDLGPCLSNWEADRVTWSVPSYASAYPPLSGGSELYTGTSMDRWNPRPNRDRIIANPETPPATADCEWTSHVSWPMSEDRMTTGDYASDADALELDDSEDG